MNRFTISSTDSTSSIGSGFSANLKSSRPRKRAEVRRLVVDQLGVFAVNFFAAEAAGDLQFVNRLRIEQMIFAAVAPLILAAGVERDAVDRAVRKRVAMPRQNFLGDHVHARRLGCATASR